MKIDASAATKNKQTDESSEVDRRVATTTSASDSGRYTGVGGGVRAALLHSVGDALLHGRLGHTW